MKHILVISDFLKEERLISNHRHREFFLEISRYSHEVDSKLRFFYNRRFLNNDVPYKKSGIALYAGQITCISQLGIYGIGLSLQENVENALNFAVKYQQILWPLVEMRIDRVGEIISLVFDSYFSVDDFEDYVFSLEYHISLAYSLLSKYLGDKIEIKSIYFKYPVPDELDAYNRIFDCDLFFDCGESKINFYYAGRAEINNPKNNGITFSLKLLRGYIDNLVDVRDSNISIRDRIFGLLDYWNQEHFPNEERVAGSLKLHPRTMRRRLEKEGYTFRQVMAEFRRNKAEQLLRTTTMSYKQIAYELWFKSSSSFSKAFEGWTGCKPSDYRKEK